MSDNVVFYFDCRGFP